MLVRKKRENLLKKKVIPEDLSSGENLQSLGSWIRKIEQSTTSVSSRLSAVEKRLSIGTIESESVHLVTMEGPVETLVLNVKKKNASELARALDGELMLLHNEMVKQEQQLSSLKEQLSVVEKMNTANNSRTSDGAHRDVADEYNNGTAVGTNGTTRAVCDATGVYGDSYRVYWYHRRTSCIYHRDSCCSQSESDSALPAVSLSCWCSSHRICDVEDDSDSLSKFVASLLYDAAKNIVSTNQPGTV